MNARFIVFVVLLALGAACATNPVTGRRELSFMSEAQEIGIAQESEPQSKAERGGDNDPERQSDVIDIGFIERVAIDE